jgi:hypothetical protein
MAPALHTTIRGLQSLHRTQAGRPHSGSPPLPPTSHLGVQGLAMASQACVAHTLHRQHLGHGFSSGGARGGGGAGCRSSTRHLRGTRMHPAGCGCRRTITLVWGSPLAEGSREHADRGPAQSGEGGRGRGQSWAAGVARASPRYGATTPRKHSGCGAASCTSCTLGQTRTPDAPPSFTGIRSTHSKWCVQQHRVVPQVSESPHCINAASCPSHIGLGTHRHKMHLEWWRSYP